jgi:CheY-like chemotaxis protein
MLYCDKENHGVIQWQNLGGVKTRRRKHILPHIAKTRNGGLKMRNLKPILLVEDDQVDAMTVKRALKDLNVTNLLVHTLNGGEALAYLTGEGNKGNKRPCITLLDLNMPKMSGIEFLKIVKADDELKKIPVVVLTTSEDIQDKLETFGLSVAGYIVKPTDYKKFVEAMRTVNIYWTLSELPDGE